MKDRGSREEESNKDQDQADNSHLLEWTTVPRGDLRQVHNPIADFRVLFLSYIYSTSTLLSTTVDLLPQYNSILPHYFNIYCVNVCRAYRSPQLGKAPLETIIGPFPSGVANSPQGSPLRRLGLDHKTPPLANCHWPIPALTGHVSLAWRALTANDRRRRGENAPSNVPYFKLFSPPGYRLRYKQGPAWIPPYT